MTRRTSAWIPSNSSRWSNMLSAKAGDVPTPNLRRFACTVAFSGKFFLPSELISRLRPGRHSNFATEYPTSENSEAPRQKHGTPPMHFGVLLQHSQWAMRSDLTALSSKKPSTVSLSTFHQNLMEKPATRPRPRNARGSPHAILDRIGIATRVRKNWLSDLDSNQDKSLQRALCYRYTIGQSESDSIG